MHALFTAGAKLLGVYFTYLGVVHLVPVAVLTDGPREAVLTQLLLTAFAWGFGFVLMFRTEWAGRLLDRFDDARHTEPAISHAAGLQTGIILIGIFVALTRLSAFLRMVAAYLGGVRFDAFGGPLLRLLIEAVPIALAVYAVLRADRVVDLIVRDRAAAGA